MILKMIDSQAISVSRDYVEKSEKIVIVVHISPDGDAIGSSLALCTVLRSMGKQLAVVAPNDFPHFLKWLPGAADILNYEVKPEMVKAKIREAELIFCLDFNEPKRIGEVSQAVLESKANKIMIDHHLDPSDFCEVVISHPEISSTSELVFKFITDLGKADAIGREAAECIYTGMMTDTGAFTYASNYPDIYFIIGELLKRGIDKDAIYDRVCNTYSENRLRMMGYLLNEKLKVYNDYHAALMTLSEKEQEKFQRKRGDTEGFVNIPLRMKEVVFSVLIREEKNMLKISFRSKGDFPCNLFASENFQGGGHKNAAGGEFYGNLEEAVSIFEKALPKYRPLLEN